MLWRSDDANAALASKMLPLLLASPASHFGHETFAPNAKRANTILFHLYLLVSHFCLFHKQLSVASISCSSFACCHRVPGTPCGWNKGVKLKHLAAAVGPEPLSVKYKSVLILKGLNRPPQESASACQTPSHLRTDASN